MCYIEDTVRILTTGIELYSKVLKPCLKRFDNYFLDRFNLSLTISYDEIAGIGYVKNNIKQEDDFIFFTFWFLDNDYKNCLMNKEDASFVAFKVINYCESFRELIDYRHSIFKDGLDYHFLYSFYDCPCVFHMDYFHKFFIDSIGLKKDYDNYLEKLKGEEVF